MGFPSLIPFATNELLPDPSGRADGETYMGGALTVSRGVVFHVNAGDGDPRGWWMSPTNHSVASAHVQIMKSGEIRQLVPLDRVAWAEVNGNGEWHSVETEGFPTEALTPAQFESFAKLLAWGHQTCGWALQVTDSTTGSGIGTHQMGGAAWGGHSCPGPIRAGQRQALCDRANQLLGAPAPAPAPAPGYPGTLPTLQRGTTSPSVAHLQRFCNDYNWVPALPLLPLTGFYGDQTTAVIKSAQAQMGVTGSDADGTIVGPRTNAALWVRGYRG